MTAACDVFGKPGEDAHRLGRFGATRDGRTCLSGSLSTMALRSSMLWSLLACSSFHGIDRSGGEGGAGTTEMAMGTMAMAVAAG